MYLKSYALPHYPLRNKKQNQNGITNSLGRRDNNTIAKNCNKHIFLPFDTFFNYLHCNCININNLPLIRIQRIIIYLYSNEIEKLQSGC